MPKKNQNQMSKEDVKEEAQKEVKEEKELRPRVPGEPARWESEPLP